MQSQHAEQPEPWKLYSTSKLGFGVTLDSHASRAKKYKVRLRIKYKVLDIGRCDMILQTTSILCMPSKRIIHLAAPLWLASEPL
jgi:hypothetical protein